MAKSLVLRNGIKILGTLPSGAGDDVLTRDSTTKEVGTVPAVDLSSYISNSLTSGHIIVGNASNIATKLAMTGQVIITSGGVTSIAPDTITNTQINSGAGITYSKLSLTNSIVNNDIAAAANIVRTKIAAGIANRILINNGSGIFSDAPAITPSRILVSDVNGIPVHSTVDSSKIAFLDVSSSIQSSLNSKATVNLTTPAAGDTLYYDGSVFINRPIGAEGEVLRVTGGLPVWGASTANGIPAGGTTDQYLTKIDGTNYNTTWTTLTVSKLTDFVGNAADLNVLQGAAAAGIIPTEIGYLDGLSGNIQSQLNGKLSSTLPLNNIFIGNSSNIAIPLAAGINGYVLTSVSGVPTWQPVSAGTPPGSDTQVIFNDGGAFGTDAGLVFDKTNNILTVGDARLHTSGAVTNLFIGRNVGNITLSGSTNTIVGSAAGALLTTGQSNTSIGHQSLNNVTTGSENTFIGAFTQGVTTGSRNIFLGNSSQATAATGDNNILIGYNLRLQSNSASGQLSIQNIIFGTGNTGTLTTPSTGNIGIGIVAPSARLHLPAGTATASTAPLKLNTGTALTTPEDGALEYHSSHLYFTIGSTRYQLDQQGGVLSGLTTNRIPYATSATTLGDDSALTWDATNNSIGLGNTRLFTVDLTYDSLFWGTNAGSFSNSGVGGNIALGHNALSAITTGENNIAIGTFAGNNKTTPAFNVFIGFQAGNNNTGGPYTGQADNIGIGRQCLESLINNAGNNIAIGLTSGRDITSGNYNVCIGNGSGDNLTTGSQCVFIGRDVDAQSATADGQLSIQNIIFGVGNTAVDATVSTGSIGIGEPAPTRKLEVAGSLAVKAGTSTGQIVRVGGVIETDTTQTGNVGTGEDVLQTYSVPADTLSIDGDTLSGTVSGTFAGNANNKTLRVRFGSALIFSVPAYANVSAASWVIRFEIIRTGATTQKCNATIIILDSVYAEYSTATETLSGAITLQVTGEATSNNDIVKETFKLRWEPSE